MNYDALFGAASIAAVGVYLLKMAFERWMRPGFRVAIVFVAIGLFVTDVGMFVMAFLARRPHYETMPLVFLLGFIGIGIGLAGVGIMAWDRNRMIREFEKRQAELADRIRMANIRQ